MVISEQNQIKFKKYVSLFESYNLIIKSVPFYKKPFFIAGHGF